MRLVPSKGGRGEEGRVKGDAATQDKLQSDYRDNKLRGGLIPEKGRGVSRDQEGG